MYSAKIIADSYNDYSRITTIEVVMPRIILAEMNTHRAFSRNSASSRAIPSARMIDSIEKNPFVPMRWMKDHKGMQGSTYFGEVGSNFFDFVWKKISKESIDNIKRFQFSEFEEEVCVSKQITNRLLEPFMFHKAVITTNEFGFENFISQRVSKHAEIHMNHVAELMLQAYNDSEAKYLENGMYHIPYSEGINRDAIRSIVYSDNSEAHFTQEQWESLFLQLQIQVSIARLARTSYTEITNEDQKDPNTEYQYLRDSKLFHELKEKGHWSPFEHVAMSQHNKISMGGNLGPGWVQYRKTFIEESKRDSRVIHKHKLK